MNKDNEKIKRIKVACLIFAMIVLLEVIIAIPESRTLSEPPFILMAILLSLFSLLSVKKMGLGGESLTAIYIAAATTFPISHFVNTSLSLIILIVLWATSFFFIHKYLEDVDTED